MAKQTEEQKAATKAAKAAAKEAKAAKQEIDPAPVATQEAPVMPDILPITTPPGYELIQVGHARQFADPDLQASVNRAIAMDAEGRKLVAVATADLEGASVSILCRLGDSWSVMGAGIYKWPGEMKAKAQVVFSPF